MGDQKSNDAKTTTAAKDAKPPTGKSPSQPSQSSQPTRVATIPDLIEIVRSESWLLQLGEL